MYILVRMNVHNDEVTTSLHVSLRLKKQRIYSIFNNKVNVFL